MTLSSTTSRVAYAGNGSTSEFAVPFLFADNSHIDVTLRGVDGVETAWSETTHYTLSGAGEPSGGTLTALAAPLSGQTLVIRRVVPLTQETDYVENDPFPAEAHEQALDLAAMRDQQLQEQLNRTLRFPITDSSPLPELPSFSSRASKLLGFDSQGDPTLFTPASADADTVTPAGASVARALAERFADFYSVKDFGATGDGTTDDTAAIRAAFAASPQIYFPPGVYKISGEIDLRGTSGLWIVGSGCVANPDYPAGFLNSAPTTILQTTANTPILRISGYGHRIDGLALIYQTQQTAAQTNATALQLNNVAASDIRNLRIMQANTSIGIPQVAFGAQGENCFWNSILANIDSNSASLCHYDLRNFNGGGTNTRLDKLYANGGGTLDFSSLGQECAYVLRGTNWSGYEVAALSIDALTFTQHLIEIENANPVSFETLRFESVNCKRNNEGWIKFGGGVTATDISALIVYRCKALMADVPSATYLVRSNSTKTFLSVAHICVASNCEFTVPIARPLSVGSTDTGSQYSFGKIDNDCSTFNSTTWSESGFPFSLVKQWDGGFSARFSRAGTLNLTYREYVGTAPPSGGTWAIGDRVIAAQPGDLGRPMGWICVSPGSPGTWVPIGLAGGPYVVNAGVDADVNLTAGINRTLYRFATTLTANRVITLQTVGAWNGAMFKFIRPAGGSFSLDVGGLKSLSANEWCEVIYDGSAWRLTGYGSL